jgi:hypothetical protein
MKLFSASLLVGVALVVGAAGARAQPKESASGGTHERIECKVLKVYAGKDGDYRSRAYLIEWNGRQVIADDPLARVGAHTDDTIGILVMHSPFPRGAESYGLLHFSALPTHPKQATARAEGEPAPAVAPKQPPQTFPLKVLKVYAAEDNGHRFRAYVVEWAGHETIVSDRLVRGRYEEGATMPTLVMKHAHPDPSRGFGLLNLTAMPSR